MLHQLLQVTIDLHKSKLYVKTKQKLLKDINSFASKVAKRLIVEVNGEWKLYLENKEVSTLTQKDMVGHLFQNYDTIYVPFFPTYTCHHSCHTIYVRFFVTYTCVLSCSVGFLFPSIWPFSYKRAYICAQKAHISVLGVKLNPLSLLFQLARYHRHNTNKRLQNKGLRTLQRNHVFSVALCLMRMRAWWLARVFCSYDLEPRVFYGFLWRQRS